MITVDELLAGELARRVRGEFMEMPELRLDVRQAQRLMGLDAPHCEAVLDALVERGVLSLTNRVYALHRSQP